MPTENEMVIAMMTIGGGQAFPSTQPLGGNGSTVSSAGMSLRDWFAGQALNGDASRERTHFNYDDIAEHAYRFADAMLAARSKGGAS